MIYPKAIAALIEQFQKFPSVGPKSAQRMAFQVLKMPLGEVEKYANAILEAKKNSKTCEICFNISTQSPCEICSSTSRNRSVICVVAETKDLIAIEKTNEKVINPRKPFGAFASFLLHKPRNFLIFISRKTRE